MARGLDCRTTIRPKKPLARGEATAPPVPCSEHRLASVQASRTLLTEDGVAGVGMTPDGSLAPPPTGIAFRGDRSEPVATRGWAPAHSWCCSLQPRDLPRDPSSGLTADGPP
jgi:hypothetical protein